MDKAWIDIVDPRTFSSDFPSNCGGADGHQPP
jgi:hypothetical protein